MINVQTFNASGDVVACENFHREGGALKLARIAFKMGCGVAINGVDCFTFAEAERALNATVAVEVAA
jgi:hypothetical protein